eukprot:4227831-Lingulodinium_polyedra.AAC.1
MAADPPTPVALPQGNDRGPGEGTGSGAPRSGPSGAGPARQPGVGNDSHEAVSGTQPAPRAALRAVG